MSNPTHRGRNMGEKSGDQHEVEVVVLALVPEFHQVVVKTTDGTRYVLNRHTPGVDLLKLREGQRLLCKVTRRLPRVLNAQAID